VRAAITDRDAFRRRHRLGDFPRRHRTGRVAQHIIDEPTTFARAEPFIPPTWLIGCFGLDVRIEQPHGRVDMRKVDPVLAELFFKLDHQPCKLGSLVS